MIFFAGTKNVLAEIFYLPIGVGYTIRMHVAVNITLTLHTHTCVDIHCGFYSVTRYE